MKRTLLISSFSALALANAAVAQRLDRSKRPVIAPAPAFKLPPMTSRTMPNGLVVRVMENHALPLVAVRVSIEGGSLLDPTGREGLFTLDTVLAGIGTTKMSPEQFADALAELGGAVTPTRITNTSVAFERSLALMGDMLMHPSFEAAQLKRRKDAYAASLQRGEDSSRVPALRIFNIAMWGAGHPFARSATAKSINAITRDDIVAFHEANVKPQNMTLTIVGDVTMEKAMAAVTKVFGGWQKTGERVNIAAPAAPAPKRTTIYLFDRPNSAQSTIFLGHPTPARSTKDFHALETMGALFGGLTGSRLSLSMRENRPLTYGVTHIVAWRRLNDPSSFHGSTNVDPMKTDSALTVWLGEVKALASGTPKEAELAFARAATVGSLGTRIETMDQMANQLAQQARDGLPLSYFDDYVKGMSAVTAADVAAAAARVVNPANLTIVVVGDRQKIESILRAANLGPVVVVDQDGRPVER